MPERPQVAIRPARATSSPCRTRGRVPTAPATSAPVVVHVPVPVKEVAAAVKTSANLGFWSRLVYLFTGSAPAAVAEQAPALKRASP